MPGFSPRPQKDAAGARDYRAYVVGDIHGRLDLLESLLTKIHSDLKRRPVPKTLLVFVGDLIDRGPNSAQVIERLRTYQKPGIQPVFLLGNHEEVLLRILEGDMSLIASWLQFGGLQCLESYGVDVRDVGRRSSDDLVEMVRNAVPASHAEFIRSFVDSCRFGDYLFVHAGIRPGIQLERQLQSDLRWIREPFLLDDTDHGFIVVHGHTIAGKVEERPNRIGIDTGAYRTGILTALVIEGDQRWVIDTRLPPQDKEGPVVDLGSPAE